MRKRKEPARALAQVEYLGLGETWADVEELLVDKPNGLCHPRNVTATTETTNRVWLFYGSQLVGVMEEKDCPSMREAAKRIADYLHGRTVVLI